MILRFNGELYKRVDSDLKVEAVASAQPSTADAKADSANDNKKQGSGDWREAMYEAYLKVKEAEGKIQKAEDEVKHIKADTLRLISAPLRLVKESDEPMSASEHSMLHALLNAEKDFKKSN